MGFGFGVEPAKQGQHSARQQEGGRFRNGIKAVGLFKFRISGKGFMLRQEGA